jgi:toxin ParE1/3/4
MKLLFAPAAEADLVDIALHIAADDTERTLNFVAELQAACNILQDHPQAGVARPDIRPDLRSKPYRRYVIYYRVLADHVRIERFLHGAQDPGPAGL